MNLFFVELVKARCRQDSVEWLKAQTRAGYPISDSQKVLYSTLTVRMLMAHLQMSTGCILPPVTFITVFQKTISTGQHKLVMMREILHSLESERNRKP